MKTVLTTLPEEAAQFIKKGGIVAFPTETVYGLGANVFDQEAIEKVFAAKKRPSDNPLIAHVGDLKQIDILVSEVNEVAKKLIDSFFPGPLTLVMPKAGNIPQIATAGLDTIGVRMPRNNLAINFLKACKIPLVAPSANLSGKPSPTTWQAVYEDLDSRIDCILQGETTEIGIESTVVDCTGKVPFILRAGAVTFEDLQKVVQEIEVYNSSKTEKPKSPGLKHKHYSPKAKVFITESTNLPNVELGKGAFIGIERPDAYFEFLKICDSIEEYAHSIYEFFRECDRRNINEIYCQEIDESEIGAALMDRLKRAATM